VLRELARGRARVGNSVGKVIELGVPVLSIGLLVAALVASRSPAAAILVGSSSVRPVATVEARAGGEIWQDCSFSPATGVYRCEGVVNVSDSSVNLLNDAPPSWAFITPAIVASPETSGVRVRITRKLRLGGAYWVGADHGTVTMTAGDDFTHEFSKRSTLEIPTGTDTVVLETTLQDSGATSITIVDEDTLVPARAYLAPPPAMAPAAISAIAGR
jgi:hypothetical protein